MLSEPLNVFSHSSYLKVIVLFGFENVFFQMFVCGRTRTLRQNRKKRKERNSATMSWTVTNKKSAFFNVAVVVVAVACVATFSALRPQSFPY